MFGRRSGTETGATVDAKKMLPIRGNPGRSLVCGVAQSSTVKGNSWHVLVRGQEADLGETPIVVELKEPLPLGLYVMDTVGGGDATAAQVFEDVEGVTWAPSCPLSVLMRP